MTTEQAPPGGKPWHPTTGGERIWTLDLLRGLAVLGILPVNMVAYSMPGLAYLQRDVWYPTEGIDLLGFGAMHIFFQMKFYAILSILFGAGIWLQTRKKDALGESPVGSYLWRMGLLALIGLVHGIGFFYGDILLAYSVCACVALFCRKLGDKVLLVLGGACVLLPMLAIGGLTVLGGLAMEIQQRPLDPDSGEAPSVVVQTFGSIESGGAAGLYAFPVTWEDAERATGGQPSWTDVANYLQDPYSPKSQAIEAAAVAQGSPAVIFAMRGISWMYMLMSFAFGLGFVVFGYMLLGIYAARRGYFTDPDTFRPVLVKVLAVGLVVAVPLHALSFWATGKGGLAWMGVGMTLQHYGAIGLAVAYIGLVLLLSRGRTFERLAAPFRAVGRMALTVYLMQSVVFSLVFAGYGLGLYGQFNHGALWGFVIACWLIQVPLAVLWLKAFKFGPVEWLWRSAAYRKLQPMR